MQRRFWCHPGLRVTRTLLLEAGFTHRVRGILIFFTIESGGATLFVLRGFRAAISSMRRAGGRTVLGVASALTFLCFTCGTGCTVFNPQAQRPSAAANRSGAEEPAAAPGMIPLPDSAELVASLTADWDQVCDAHIKSGAAHVCVQASDRHLRTLDARDVDALSREARTLLGEPDLDSVWWEHKAWLIEGQAKSSLSSIANLHIRVLLPAQGILPVKEIAIDFSSADGLEGRPKSWIVFHLDRDLSLVFDVPRAAEPLVADHEWKPGRPKHPSNAAWFDYYRYMVVWNTAYAEVFARSTPRQEQVKVLGQFLADQRILPYFKDDRGKGLLSSVSATDPRVHLRSARFEVAREGSETSEEK